MSAPDESLDEQAVRSVARLIEVFAGGDPSRVRLAFVRDGRRVAMRFEIDVVPGSPLELVATEVQKALTKARVDAARKDDAGG